MKPNDEKNLDRKYEELLTQSKELFDSEQKHELSFEQQSHILDRLPDKKKMSWKLPKMSGQALGLAGIAASVALMLFTWKNARNSFSDLNSREQTSSDSNEKDDSYQLVEKKSAPKSRPETFKRNAPSLRSLPSEGKGNGKGVNLSNLGIIGRSKSLSGDNSGGANNLGSTKSFSPAMQPKKRMLRGVTRKENYFPPRKPISNQRARLNSAMSSGPLNNPFIDTEVNPVSTFAADVDTASYARLRNSLMRGILPDPRTVRIEEMVNYFNYDYKEPVGNHPFSVDFKASTSPWNPDNLLVRVGIQGKSFQWSRRPAINLVLLLDVSGSMHSHKKLPLLKRSLKFLVDQLDSRDRVAIVTYASSSKVVLESTSAANRDLIMNSVYNLRAGGSTNGSGGIQTAYSIAKQNYIKGGVNRVLIATDGDFNVGISSPEMLKQLIAKKAKSGVSLSIVGLGMNNYRDKNLETLANRGNGNYAYIDSVFEAQKVLAKEVGGSLIDIAKDVKLQADFDPKTVKRYRLIGFENRLIGARDFHDDSKDGGEIGAGHQVTAFYEIETHKLPAKEKPFIQKLLPFMAKDKPMRPLFKMDIRYKQPKGSTSKLISYQIPEVYDQFEEMDDDFRFAASVAMFGMHLKNDPNRGSVSLNQIERIAIESTKGDSYRSGFVNLVRNAKSSTRSEPD